MEQYHELLKEVLGQGDVQFEPRTQTYMIGISGSQKKYDLRDGFPLMTTKKVPKKAAFEEQFWKLRGERNVKSLFDRNVHIWDANAYGQYLKRNNLVGEVQKHSGGWNKGFDEYQDRLKNEPGFAEREGDLGPVYGYQWRNWTTPDGMKIDQLTELLEGIKVAPGSRYHILDSWNVGELKKMAIGPCPFHHQFTVWGDQLDLTMTQRSCDTFLGVPFNIAEDSLLTHMVANETGLNPRYFIHNTNNTHIYLGVPPRANFWGDKDKVEIFQRQFNSIEKREDYLELREWYLNNSPEEFEENKGIDHIPNVLMQLSIEPKELPTIKILKDIPFMEAIKMPALDYVKVNGYNPHKWDSKATMAA